MNLTLGFHDSIRPVIVYCNNQKASNWYQVVNDKPVAYEHNSLTGYLKCLKAVKVVRRNQEQWKLHVSIQADRAYILEMGVDSHFAKGLLSAIAALEPDDLKQPFTVEAQPGDEAFFCACYSAGVPIEAKYDKRTDFKLVAKIAMNLVNQETLI
jgi:hypothetical protein